jgi:hypothetical protein
MYGIRFGSKSLSKNGHRRRIEEFAKNISRSTEIHNPSARRVTSDLALDPNKPQHSQGGGGQHRGWQKNSLSPLLSIYLPLRTIIQVDDRSAKSQRLNILQTLFAKAASCNVFRTGWGGHTPGNPRPSRLGTRSRKPKQSTVQSIFALDFHRRD